MTQGSYLLIQRGMTVRGEDGDLGKVHEIVAEEAADVFRGIVVSHGLVPPRRAFVAAEQVERVTDDSIVYVTIRKADFDSLPESG